jgi:hypothetical protein
MESNMVGSPKKPKVTLVDDTPENIQVLRHLKDQALVVRHQRREGATVADPQRHHSRHHDARDGFIRGVRRLGGYARSTFRGFSASMIRRAR